MAKEYTKKQLWELYNKLPPTLKEVVFSEKAAETIYNVCEKNNIDRISSLTRYIQDVLLGILRPSEFQATIETGLGLKKDVTKKVAQEIHRFIFYPVKSSLEELYSMEIASPTQMKTPGPVEKKPKPSKRKDSYREPVQ